MRRLSAKARPHPERVTKIGKMTSSRFTPSHGE
ncbi:Uncharacterised protein [Mycobacteroides abscessus]|nr:Uncharacterised protein [Mycobacteroides abscessus]